MKTPKFHPFYATPLSLPLLRPIFLAVLAFCMAAVSHAQIPFGTGFLPTFDFTEKYTDTVVMGDFGYEQVAGGSLTANARLSMKDVVVADLTADTSSLVVKVANLQLDLPLVDAVQSDASGYHLYTWPLTTTDLNTGDQIQVGSVVMKYNATDLKITVTATGAPGTYSIYAAQEAGADETLTDQPLVMSLSVGPYTTDDMVLYVSGTASTFDKTVGVGDAAQTFYGLANVSLKGLIDSTPPVVKLVYPKPQFYRNLYTVTDRPLTATGTCSDAYNVASVEVQLNDGLFETSDISGISWSAPGLLPIDGKNKIVVRCTDQNGHVTSYTTYFLFSPVSPLTVDAAGNAPGKVTSLVFPTLSFDPAAPSPKAVSNQKDGTPLVVTAVPGPNAVFDGWTSNKTTFTPAQLASARLSFKHSPNTKLTAHFLINPFNPVKGRYNGLATGTSASGHGFFSVTLAANGTFTGSIRVGTTTLKLKGKFSNTGRFTRTVKIDGIDYALDLTLNVTGTGTEQITGTIRGGNVDVVLTAPRSTYNKLTNPAPQTGVYNVIIPPVAGQPDTYPVGIGIGRVTVSSSGSVRFIGRTATSPTFNASAQLAPNGTWPLFSPLYGKRGSLSGIATFDLQNPAHDLSATLTWFKPSGVINIPVYTNGFTGQSTLLGAKFTAPGAGQRLFLDASGGAGKLTLSAPTDAALPALQVVGDAALSTSNAFTAQVPADAAVQKVQFLVNPLTGQFGGSFVEGTAVRKFTGIIVGPKLNRAAGFFRRDTRTGSIDIVAP